MSRRKGKKIPTCSGCGVGVTWLTVRGNRVPFDRLPVDDPSANPTAMPCYRGEAWSIGDLRLELQAVLEVDGPAAHRHIFTVLPWHRPHVCPVASQEA